MKLTKESIGYRTLSRALNYKRPSGSTAETSFGKWLISNLPGYAHTTVWVDDVGNIHVDNRKTTTNRTIFTAHMDTVHTSMGRNLITKTATHWKANGAPLGADDGAGCAILMNLIHRDIGAYYCFTVSEERGGIGAGHLAEHHKDLLAEFDRAVAFDRRGTSSVITHQMVGRTCSDKFAEALSDALGTDTLMYAPDDTGSYTDTAEFIGVIPECTNISVGYEREHSANETLNLDHFLDLLNHVVTINWDILPVERDPALVEFDTFYDYGGLHTTYKDNYIPMGDITEQDVIDLIKALRAGIGSNMEPLLKICGVRPELGDHYFLEINDAHYCIEELEYVLDTKHSKLTTVYYDVLDDLAHTLRPAVG